MCSAVAKKMVTLLDFNRSRIIEISLPSFPFAVNGMDTLSDHLNCITDDSVLQLEHIVTLKRYGHQKQLRRVTHVGAGMQLHAIKYYK